MASVTSLYFTSNTSRWVITRSRSLGVIVNSPLLFFLLLFFLKNTGLCDISRRYVNGDEFYTRGSKHYRILSTLMISSRIQMVLNVRCHAKQHLRMYHASRDKSHVHSQGPHHSPLPFLSSFFFPQAHSRLRHVPELWGNSQVFHFQLSFFSVSILRVRCPRGGHCRN